MSEWNQQFDPPNQRRDCIHGSLARSCRICELEHQVFDLERERDQWREMAMCLGKSLNHQNENWGLYGNESQQALAAFNAMI
jgi:hypothetical protein